MLKENGEVKIRNLENIVRKFTEKTADTVISEQLKPNVGALINSGVLAAENDSCDYIVVNSTNYYPPCPSLRAGRGLGGGVLTSLAGRG